MKGDLSRSKTGWVQASGARRNRSRKKEDGSQSREEAWRFWQRVLSRDCVWSIRRGMGKRVGECHRVQENKIKKQTGRRDGWSPKEVIHGKIVGRELSKRGEKDTWRMANWGGPTWSDTLYRHVQIPHKHFRNL